MHLPHSKDHVGEPFSLGLLSVDERHGWVSQKMHVMEFSTTSGQQAALEPVGPAARCRRIVGDPLLFMVLTPLAAHKVPGSCAHPSPLHGTIGLSQSNLW